MGFWSSIVVICIVMAIAGVLITYIERNYSKGGNGKNNKLIEKSIEKAKIEIIDEIKKIQFPVASVPEDNKKEERIKTPINE